MAKTSTRYTIPGSDRKALPGARAAAPVMPDERIEVSVRVRPRPGQRGLDDGGALADQLPAERQYLSRTEYSSRHGASAADIAKVKAFAKAHQLAVVEASAARRTVVLSGTAATLGKAFGTTLRQFEHDGGTYRGRTGALSVPGDLAGVVEGVFGLDNRPQASPHFQVLGAPGVAIARAPGAAFTPPQLAALYDFPSGVDGSGQCIAIIELGGGFKPADISAYFTGLELPVPNVKAISVDGGRNRPTNANSADGEVMLDIEVAAAIAPKATIAVYFAPNTDQGFLDAITTAVHDTVNKPSVISISWGSAESNWTAQAMKQFDQAFQEAASDGRDRLLRGRRQRLGRRRRRRQAARRLPGLQPVRPRLRRHLADGFGQLDQQRGGLERERQDQRHRRRRERILPAAGLPEERPRCRRWRAARRPAAACPTSPATPIRTAAIVSASTASRW